MERKEAARVLGLLKLGRDRNSHPVAAIDCAIAALEASPDDGLRAAVEREAEKLRGWFPGGIETNSETRRAIGRVLEAAGFGTFDHQWFHWTKPPAPPSLLNAAKSAVAWMERAGIGGRGRDELQAAIEREGKS